jgi:hypothetical protein
MTALTVGFLSARTSTWIGFRSATGEIQQRTPQAVLLEFFVQRNNRDVFIYTLPNRLL